MLGPTRSTPTVCTPKGTWTTALPTRSPPFDSTSRTSCSPSRLGDERVILPGAAGADPGPLPGRARGPSGLRTRRCGEPSLRCRPISPNRDEPACQASRPRNWSESGPPVPLPPRHLPPRSPKAPLTCAQFVPNSGAFLITPAHSSARRRRDPCLRHQTFTHTYRDQGLGLKILVSAVQSRPSPPFFSATCPSENFPESDLRHISAIKSPR